MSDVARRARPDPRITRRRKAIERSRKKRLFGGILAVVLAVVIAWAAFWSPLVQVRTVRVYGSRHVTGADIRRVARIGSGTNLLLLSTSKVVERVEALPWVRRARVQRSLPGTVRVRIVERRPVLSLTQGSSRWFIDRAGYVIGPAEGSHRLPTLAGVHDPGLKPGMRLTGAAGVGALKAWRSLPPKLESRLAAVLAPTPDAITLSLKDGTTIRYGSPQSAQNKNRVLLALLHKSFVEGRGASYIDVRVPTSPAVARAPTPAASAPVAGAAPAAAPGATVSPSPTPTQ
jgi:cell division protein FtsQ